MSLNRGDVFAGYTVVRLLVSGDEGEVYLVEHPRLPRQEVLMLLNTAAPTGSDRHSRFIHQADLASQLWNPHIVRVNDRGESNGTLWIVTDYVDGRDTGQILRDQYPAGFPLDQVCAIVTSVAEALDYAHGQGVLHRDVRPENILVANSEGTANRILLKDFVSGREPDEPSGTLISPIRGAVYAAPEQLMGADIDGRADQYSLAITALHLLTGISPNADSDPVTVLSKHLNSPPPLPGARRPDLADLDPVFVTVFAKSPSERFASCGEFAQALCAAADNAQKSYQPTEAVVIRGEPKVSAPSSNARNGHRQKALLAAIAAALIAASTVTVLNLAHRERGSNGPSLPDKPSVMLDGSYQFTYTRGTGTVNGLPDPKVPEAETVRFWAFRSACKSTACIATATQLDGENPRQAANPLDQRIFRYTDGRWQQSPVRSDKDLPTCVTVEGKIGAGRQTSEVSRSLAAEPDGTLRGVQTDIVLNSECGGQGAIREYPFAAMRLAELPPDVPVADPLLASFPEPQPAPRIVPPSPTSPRLDGSYRFELDYSRSTLNRVNLHATGSETQMWALRSICSPERCVATGIQLDDSDQRKAKSPPGTDVLEFRDGHWQEPTPVLMTTACNDGKDADTLGQWRFTPQIDGTFEGTFTTTIMTNECGTKDDIQVTPIRIVRTGDLPLGIVLADPALFL